jgi:hypothetical protein
LSLASVSDVVLELRGTTTDGGNTYNIFDQNIASANVNVYLQEAYSWLQSQEPQAYNSGSAPVLYTVKRLEIHYTCAHLLGTMFGFIITDGHTLAINGINQARFQAKSEGYRAIIMHYVSGIPQLWAALNDLFFAAGPGLNNPEGNTVYNTPIYYWGYAPFA